MAVDAASFEILGSAFARDESSVYLIMSAKFKSLKGADPVSFRALGGSYGVDATQAWHRDKPLRLKERDGSLTKFRELAPGFAADGKVIIKETKVRSEPAPFDLSRAVARVLTYDRWVGEDIATTVDGRTYLLADGQTKWVELGPVNIDMLHRIVAADTAVGKHHFLSDGVKVFWRGLEVTGADPRTAKALSRDVVADAHACFVGSRKLPFAPHELAFLTNQLFAGHEDVFIGHDGVF